MLLLEEKGDIFLKNFFYLVAFWSFLSSVLDFFFFFIHKLRDMLDSRELPH